MRLPAVRAAAALAGVVVLVGCSSGVKAGPTTSRSSVSTVSSVSSVSSGSSAPSPRPSTTTHLTVTSTVRTTVTNSTVTSTGIRTVSGTPPAPTPEPAPVQGSCPYLPDGELENINGQRSGPTMLTTVKPYPICDFYRSDGGWQARVRIVRAATPAAAEAAVDQHVPVDASAPASQPPGWSGGSMTTPEGIAGNADVRSVYAVSKGPIAIVAESNQAQTIKGRQMVIEVVDRLGR